MKKNTTQTARNNETANCALHAALNAALPGDGTAPDWVELIPAGTQVTGIDGRIWLNDQPQGIIDFFTRLKASNREMPIDWEHSSEHKAPKGDPAPAAGWITELEIREGGAIWGRVDWTPRGLESVANREYRYLSPVIVYQKASSRIVGITTAGLTNQPNLKLQALNREEPASPKENAMKKIYAALGLPETATEEQAEGAIAKLQGDLASATNRAETPSLDKFVPRADYDTAVSRATNAEQALATQKKAELETEITTEIDAALQAGKITPPTKDYHIASCRQEGGLERFREFVKTAPVIGDASGLAGKEAVDGQGVALNADQTKIADMFGNTAEDLKKYGA